LQQKRHILGPGQTEAQTRQLGVHIGDLTSEMVESVQVVLDAQLFDRIEGDGLPPSPMAVSRDIAGRSREIEAEEHAPQPVLGHALLGRQMLAMDHQRTELADVGWWNPDLGQQIGGQQLGQDEGVPLIVFDFGTGNQADLLRMSDDDLSHLGNEQIVQNPGVGGGFDGDLIGGAEMTRGPRPKTL